MDRKLIIVGMIILLLGTFLVGCGSAEWPAAPDLSGVETLCLEIEQPRTEDETDWIYYDEDIERMLSRLNFELVRGGVACDAMLALTGKGWSRGGPYKSRSSGQTTHCYTGANVSGAVTLTVDGQEPVALPIGGSKPKEETTNDCYSSPPYYIVIYSPMLDALEHFFGADFLARNLIDEKDYIREHAMEGFRELDADAGPALFDCLWSRDLRAASLCAAHVGEYDGTEVIPLLLEKLATDNVQSRCMAAKALGHIGSEALEAVPDLISLLNDGRELQAGLPVSQYALEALQAITGEEFGNESAEWQAWWEVHQE